MLTDYTANPYRSNYLQNMVEDHSTSNTLLDLIYPRAMIELICEKESFAKKFNFKRKSNFIKVQSIFFKVPLELVKPDQRLNELNVTIPISLKDAWFHSNLDPNLDPSATDDPMKAIEEVNDCIKIARFKLGLN
ncbi:hypothetical protein BpHYR1_054116 [Brachionus plicatilis]|uniref:Uncharacterized protein n=1 Tax=Brachionus plicatilis TaxID=10195 RepID=A0A3M7SMP0_BRAPC|nr:hypothetical protein BpHYR1_054116 [Brachionus plicatilis]